MAKKLALGTVVVFIIWFVLDYVIHGMILGSSYANNQDLYRSMEEMKMGLLNFVRLVSSFTFVYIYAQLLKDKGLMPGVIYGLVFGVGAGISMGYGTYATMPIDYYMALVWFLGTMIEATAAGAALGMLIKD